VDPFLLYRRKAKKILAALSVLLLCSIIAKAQSATNSVYVNFGRLDCGDSWDGTDITLVSDAQINPDNLLNCNTDAEIGSIFSKFISYNATNNKLYINDISDYTNSNIYILNMGLPSNCTCPTISGVNYTIPNVILSQFEFDPLGDLYALSNYDPSTGIASIGAYDDTTGNLQPGSLKTLYFPSGHFPTDVLNGDIAIAPNGRLFCVFGGDTSKFFEITNYSKTVSGNATATYLGEPSRVCYGLAYDNGYIVMGGTDLGGTCYCFRYNLANDTLSSQLTSPINVMPIDDTSFSPAVGLSMKLVSAAQVDATHYTLTYQIYVKNMGNSKVGNLQIKDNLAGTFGSGNISNVTTSFVSNGAGLVLNSNYNGSSSLNILTSGAQAVNLSNYPSNKSTSTIQLQVTVANPTPNYVYYNSALISGKIGKDTTQLTLFDSSNNYSSSYHSWSEAVDPNSNGVADDWGEGVPTPWMMGTTLPIELGEFNVQAENDGADLLWTTMSEKNNRYFAVERSTDAKNFDSIGRVNGAGTSLVGHSYSYFDSGPPKGTIYYRLRQVNSDGSSEYSEIRVIKLQTNDAGKSTVYSVFPNPATDYIVFSSSESNDEDAVIDIQNMYGVNVFSALVPGSSLREKIMLPALPGGYYFVSVKNPSKPASFFKIFINR